MAQEYLLKSLLVTSVGVCTCVCVFAFTHLARNGLESTLGKISKRHINVLYIFEAR